MGFGITGVFSKRWGGVARWRAKRAQALPGAAFCHPGRALRWRTLAVVGGKMW